MEIFGVVFFQLVVLYFLARALKARLYLGVVRIFRNKRLAMYVYALFFLPGTYWHEMAHYLTARLFLVPTGALDLKPKITGNGLMLGSVSIGRVDMLRRFIIGSAPFLAGLVGILVIGYYYKVWAEYGWYGFLFAGVLIFEISNTMFLSRKDLEQIWIFGVVLAAVVCALWLVGLGAEMVMVINTLTSRRVAELLMVPIVIDFLVLLLLYSTNAGEEKKQQFG